MKDMGEFHCGDVPYPQKSYEYRESRAEQGVYDNRNKVAKYTQKEYITASLTNICDVMSRSVRDIFKAGAIAAMMAVPTSAATNANDKAVEGHPGAAEYTLAASELAQARKSVGVNNSTTFDKDEVRIVTAAASSKKRIALALYGADSSYLNEARLGVWDAKQSGINVSGIVIGSLNEDKGYEVFGNGHLWAERTTEELERSNDVRHSVYTSIKYADSSMKKLSAELASTSPATLASVTYDNN